MDFSWTDEQARLYDEAASFAAAKVNPAVAERAGATFGRDDWRLLGELGLVGLSIPAEHGGKGLDAQTTARTYEGFARACDDPGFVFGAAAHLFAVAMPIAEHADEQLKARYLPGLADGTLIGANAITEPEAGSDVFSLKARAERDGDGYRITGTKSFVTNAPVADCFLVYASTEPAYGYMGISAFVVDRDSPGLTVGEHFDKIGLKTTPVSAVHFDGCYVPEANRVGDEGQGAGIFSGSMGWERACLFAQYVGLMERQLDEVVRFVKGRTQFGKSLAKFQAVTHKVADMKLRLEGARLLLYRACWMKDQGIDATMEIALSKVAVSEAAVQSGLDAIQLFGGAGVKAGGIESMLRDAIPSTIFSGTSEIQRDLIARGCGL